MIWRYSLASDFNYKKTKFCKLIGSFFEQVWVVKCEQETNLQHRRCMEYYFGEWHESGLSDRMISKVMRKLRGHFFHHLALLEKQMQGTVTMKLKACLLRISWSTWWWRGWGASGSWTFSLKYKWRKWNEDDIYGINKHIKVSTILEECTMMVQNQSAYKKFMFLR